MGRLVLAAGCLAAVAATGCQKKPPAVAATQPAPPPPAPVDQRNTNFQAGAGAVQNVRKAAARTVSINDMHQLGTFVEQMYSEGGKMPAPKEIKDSIRRDAPKVVADIDEGAIILTGTKDHAGLWAYEVDADKAGGIVLVAGKANRADAAEVQQLLARK